MYTARSTGMVSTAPRPLHEARYAFSRTHLYHCIYRAEVYTEFGLDWIQNNGMKSVLLRHVPQLGQALEGVNNAFAPWNVLRAEPWPSS